MGTWVQSQEKVDREMRAAGAAGLCLAAASELLRGINQAV